MLIGCQDKGLNAHTRLLEKMASMFLPPAVAILAQVQTARKQTAVSGAFWPAAGVRERQQFGGPTRTTGLGQADRKRLDPQLTQSRLTMRPNGVPEADSPPSTDMSSGRKRAQVAGGLRSMEC
jgi:hypothetical protein